MSLTAFNRVRREQAKIDHEETAEMVAKDVANRSKPKRAKTNRAKKSD